MTTIAMAPMGCLHRADRVWGRYACIAILLPRPCVGGLQCTQNGLGCDRPDDHEATRLEDMPHFPEDLGPVGHVVQDE
jgi:hypothetical protein